jgi:hypothetical protein
MTADAAAAQRLAGGWEKRTTCDEPRLTELCALYREIGFEVRLEPFAPEGTTGCAACHAGAPGRCQTIYTRRREVVP